MLLDRFGPAVVAVPAVLLFAVVVVQRPLVAVGLFVGLTVLLEADPAGFLPATQALYSGIPAPIDFFFVLAVGAALVEMGRSGNRLRLPGPFTLPLLLLALAFVGGAATGYLSGGGRGEMQGAMFVALYFVLTPFLVVNAAHSRDRVRALAAAALVLAAAKGVIGCAAWALGLGRTIGDTVLTYYEPTANWLMVIVLLLVVAAPLVRAPLPLWAKVAMPFVLVALILSFRRAFWLAGGLGLVTLFVCVVVAETRRSRVLLPLAVIAVLGVGAYLAAGSGARDNPLAERAQTLSPTRAQQSAHDRYRIDETRNVRAEISRAPLAGIGLGVPWEARHALAVQHPAGRQYNHVVLLWYWLKLGIIGLIGIVWLFAAAIWSAYRLWRAGAEPWLRAAGLAVMCAFLGLLVAETTASFTGVDLRFSILVGTVIGWLAAAGEIRPAPPPPR